jgi:hypothetical protein
MEQKYDLVVVGGGKSINLSVSSLELGLNAR